MNARLMLLLLAIPLIAGCSLLEMTEGNARATAQSHIMKHEPILRNFPWQASISREGNYFIYTASAEVAMPNDTSVAQIVGHYQCAQYTLKINVYTGSVENITRTAQCS